MICNSCLSPITSGEKTVECGVCSKSMHSDCPIKEEEVIYCDRCYSEKDSLPVKIDVPEIIRRSYIQTYKDCPYKFFKQVIEGVEGEMGIHAQVGVDLHDIFEDVSRGIITSPDELLSIYRPMFEAYEERHFQRALNLYKNMSVIDLQQRLWQQSYDSAYQIFEVLRGLPKEPYVLEEKILLSVGEGMPKVSITMDRLDLVDGKIEITDWKTGAVMVGKKLSTDIQVPLYIKAVEEHYGIPVSKFTLQYLSEAKTRVFEHISGDDYTCMVGKRGYKINTTEVVREVQQIFSQILNGNFSIPGETKGMFFTCKICHLKEMGVCQGADVQGWRNIQ